MDASPKPKPAVLLVHKEGGLTPGLFSSFMLLADQPLVAHTGEMAIRMVRENNNIRLVLIGMDLPDFNGIETVIRIRETQKTLPIVLLTHYLTVETMQVANIIGCNDIIQEPVTPEMVQSILGKYLTIRPETCLNEKP